LVPETTVDSVHEEAEDERKRKKITEAVAVDNGFAELPSFYKFIKMPLLSHAQYSISDRQRTESFTAPELCIPITLRFTFYTSVQLPWIVDAWEMGVHAPRFGFDIMLATPYTNADKIILVYCKLVGNEAQPHSKCQACMMMHIFYIIFHSMILESFD